MSDKIEEFIRSLESTPPVEVEKIVEVVENEYADSEDENSVENVVETEENNAEVVNSESDDEEHDDEQDLIDSIANARQAEESLESLPKNVQKKINRETAARKQAEEENGKLRQQLASFSSSAPAPSQVAPVDEFYINEDLPVGEQIKLHLQAQEKQREANELSRKQSAHFAALSEQAQAKSDKGRSMFADYDEVVAPITRQLTSTLLMVLPKCEHMGKVLYYLGKNPVVASDFFKTTDSMELVMKVSKLDQKLSKKPVAKKVSSAPKPSPKVGSVAGHGSKAADVGNMKMSDFKNFYKTL